MSDPRREVIVQPAAIEDIRRQVAYLRHEASEEVALRCFKRAYASCDDLAQAPGMGREISNRVLPDLRRWRVKDFEKILIFYRFDDSAVYVIRVLHGAMDLDSLLSNEWELQG